MPDYPLMFSVRDAISGNGFLAGVTMSGRVMIRLEDDDKWWMYGVRPTGITAFGNTPEEAFLRFRENYKNVLFDLAEDSSSYETFRDEVDALYSQANEEEERNWESALKAIRAGGAPTEGYISTLKRKRPETNPTQCTVVRLDKQKRYTATDNTVDYFALAKAA